MSVVRFVCELKVHRAVVQSRDQLNLNLYAHYRDQNRSLRVIDQRGVFKLGKVSHHTRNECP